MLKLTRFTVVLSIIILFLFYLPSAGFGGITLTTITPKITSYNPKWTSTTDTTLVKSLGALPLTVGNTLTYSFPASGFTVPSTAVEILVCPHVFSNTYASAYGILIWRIYTQETSANGGAQYAQFFVNCLNQSSTNYSASYSGSSVSFWLPCTGDEHIYATLTSANCGTSTLTTAIEIVGYR